MSGSFDAYHKWLGISPKDQPPHHYRLLAIDLFESDPEVISSAADQRMGHVRAFQTGKHSALSQQLLNEIAAARVCLLSPEKKAEYDRQLRGQLGIDRPRSERTGKPISAAPQPPELPPLPPAMPPLDEPVPPRFEAALPSRRLRRKGVPWQALTAILVAAVILLGGLILLTTRGGPQQAAGPAPKPPPSIEPRPSEPPPTTSKPSESPGTQNLPSLPGKEPEKTRKSAPEEAISSPEPGRPGPGHDPAVSKPPETTPEQAPVPDAAAQAGAEARLQQTLASAPTAELLTAARADQRPSDERFVLLKKARDVAVEEEDVDTALAATDEIIRRYEVDALETQVETFRMLRQSVTTPSVARALTEKGFALLDDAAAADNKDLALQVAEDAIAVAKKSDDNELFKQAVMRFVNLQESP